MEQVDSNTADDTLEEDADVLDRVDICDCNEYIEFCNEVTEFVKLLICNCKSAVLEREDKYERPMMESVARAPDTRSAMFKSANVSNCICLCCDDAA